MNTKLVHSDKLAELMQATAYTLADMADVNRSGGGAGDRFLLAVRDAWADELINDEGLPLAPDEAEDIWNQIADDAPSVYTGRKWEQFTDLSAWQEDVSEFVNVSTDIMDQLASMSLYQIADRLLHALYNELHDDDQIVTRQAFYDELLYQGWKIVDGPADVTETYGIANDAGHVLTYYTTEQFMERCDTIVTHIPLTK
jgi:hypothetical protein